MKPILEYLPRASNESFVVKYFDYPAFPTPWHFHPEYELVLVVESTGTKLIGDHSSAFAPGDLLLIGQYLPHTYNNSPQYLEASGNLRAKSIVVHFGHDVFGEGFFDLPELKIIADLLGNSRYGIAVGGETNALVSSRLHQMAAINDFTRLSLLLDILHILSISKDLNYLNAHSELTANEEETYRMSLILGFVSKNFSRQFAVKEVADLVNLTQNSFSRHFTQRTRKSFTAFLNEVRLKHAAKQLVETSQPVIDISLGSGFLNLSNFNRQFRKLYGTNPLSYRKHYLKNSGTFSDFRSKQVKNT